MREGFLIPSLFLRSFYPSFLSFVLSLLPSSLHTRDDLLSPHMPCSHSFIFSLALPPLFSLSLALTRSCVRSLILAAHPSLSSLFVLSSFPRSLSLSYSTSSLLSLFPSHQHQSVPSFSLFSPPYTVTRWQSALTRSGRRKEREGRSTLLLLQSKDAVIITGAHVFQFSSIACASNGGGDDDETAYQHPSIPHSL